MAGCSKRVAATQVVKASEDAAVTKDIPGEVRRLVQRRIDVAEDRLTLEASFTDLGADSFAMFEMTLDFEVAFGIEIPDDEATKMRTVGDAIRAVEKLVREQHLA